MTQKSQGLVWGFIIHSARSSQCGTRKKGREGDGQGRGYLGPAGPGMNPCLALVPLTTVFVPSAREAALGTNTPRKRRQHLCISGSFQGMGRPWHLLDPI